MNNKAMDTTLPQITLVEWIKTALSSPTLTPPERIVLNGYSERADVREAIASIALVHKQTGITGLKKAWESTIAPSIPDIAEIINRPRHLWHISELEKRPPVKWLIPGKIPENGLTTIFGASEAGKSFLAVEYAAYISLSRPVIYIAGEGESGYYARYHAWLKHFGHKKAGQFYLFDEAVQMLEQKSFEAFMEEARSIQPAMVVVDTLIRCFKGGDENSSKDVGLFTAACDEIRKAFNCAVVIVHHVTKATGTERGSGALRNNSDSMIEVINNDNAIQVVCSKTKDKEHWPTEYYRRMQVEVEQDGETVTSCVLLPWQQVKVEPTHLTQNQIVVLEILASEMYLDCGAKTSDVSTVSGISRSTLYHVLTNLLKRGYVRKPGKRSDPYFITGEGNDLLKSVVKRHP